MAKPESVTVHGPPTVVSTVRVDVVSPALSGAKKTLKTQLLPPASGFATLQLLSFPSRLKPDPAGILKLVKVNGLLPLFVARIWSEVGTPATSASGKSAGLGDRTRPAAEPMIVTGCVKTLPPEVRLMLRVELTDPTVVGV